MPFHALIHASEVLTGAGVRSKDGRRVVEEDLGRIKDGAVVYSVKRVGKKALPDRIEWVGPTSKLPAKYARAKKRDLKGKQAIVPGLVDCHNHLIFAGDRASEFAERCGGATYEQIAAKGGGIVTTVRATREASEAELLRLAVARARESYRYGVRTLEIKSGYGLSMEAELKILRVAKKLEAVMPEMTFVRTFLGAHAFPTDRSREEYLADLHAMIDRVAREKLAQACDVFIDQGYFTLDEGRTLLEHARSRGLKVKVHADELANTESAALAAELGALSADHLLKVSDEGVRALASSQTVAVLLPGTAFYLKAAHAPARKLIDAGACLAISTDFNPGTCMTLSLPSVLTISALYLGLTRAELFASVTYNAAKALGLEKRKGTLERGRDADLTVLPFERFEEYYYRFAWS